MLISARIVFGRVFVYGAFVSAILAVVSQCVHAQCGDDIDVLRTHDSSDNSYPPDLGIVVDLGDLDGDGFHEYLISDPGADGLGFHHNGVGRVTIYDGATGEEQFTAYGEDTHGHLGRSACVIPDQDGDGVREVAVGAPANEGQVLIFSGAARGVSTPIALLTQGDDEMYRRFGQSVDCSGDFDGDGHNDLAVGEPGQEYGSNYGRIFVYSGVDLSLIEKIEPDGVNFIGVDLRYIGERDAGGRNAIVSTGRQSGIYPLAVAFMFQYKNVSVESTPIPNSESLPVLRAVRLDAGIDATGDGVPDLLAYAIRDVPGDLNVVSVISGSDFSLHGQFTGRPLEQFADERLIPDVDGDGRADILIAAPTTESPFDDPPPPPPGRAIVVSTLNFTIIAEYGCDSTSAFARSVTTVGDINDDGEQDFLFGSLEICNVDSQCGVAHLIAGIGGVDCNDNGEVDSFDLFSETSVDCNANFVPDECDIASGFSFDFDCDVVPDECDEARDTFYRLLWSDAATGQSRRSLPDATAPEDFTSPLITQPISVAFDAVGERVFVLDGADSTIYAMNYDGENVTPIVSGLADPKAIAVDTDAGELYFSEAGAGVIRRANTDGSNIEDILTGLAVPRGIALDVDAGHIYWAENGTDVVRRADLGGSNIETIIDTGLTSPNFLALDFVRQHLYVSDSTANQTVRVDFDGENQIAAPFFFQFDVKGIAVDGENGFFYWASAEFGRVYRQSLTDAFIQIIAEDLVAPHAVALDLRPQPDEDCDRDGAFDRCQFAADPDSDLNQNGVLDICEDFCPGDVVDANLIVDENDLMLVLSQWGTAGPDGDVTGDDANGFTYQPDGVVDLFDLLVVLKNWGACF